MEKVLGCGITKACAAPSKSTTTRYSGRSKRTILKSTFADRVALLHSL